ncbi:hypothetical protein [Paraburkholderia xenovorans]|uniref:Uncharacterized protein n=2 Tax=Paraburkholderia xenovorans TaxID=36873 RepID=Q13N03_PARXL|nr:hypothetical protein [Paraburkholderia xenovorans]ABE34536.1 hypothetical protein Bxe_B1428 [Paraburkholderia xenovorans LB400]NPT33338.1 hypothetical protein [Paraburkholderia xenovorans]
MIADTRYVAIDLPATMKEFGYLAHRNSDEATKHAAVPLASRYEALKRVGSVLLVAVILACIHREISGANDGSLLCAVSAYVNGRGHELPRGHDSGAR